MTQVVDTLIIELHPADWGAGKEAIEKLKKSLDDSGFELVKKLGSDYIYKNTKL